MNEFVSNIMTQVLSSSIVAVASYIYLLKYEPLFSKPKLSILIKQNGAYSESLTFTNSDNRYAAEFDLSILNVGNKVLPEKQGFWHLYIEGGIFNYESKGLLDFTDGNHLRNIIEFPVLPDGLLDLNLHLKLSFADSLVDKIKVYGSLSTAYGVYPKNAKINNLGVVEYEKMQNIKINLV